MAWIDKIGVGRTVVLAWGRPAGLLLVTGGEPPEPEKKPERLVTGEQPKILVVGKPGHVRDALAGLLSSPPLSNPVACVDSGLLALKSVRSQPTSLVLVTSSLPDEEIPELVRQIKQAWPGLPCLVLSEKIEHQREALFAGADRVVPASQPTNYLITTINELIK